MGTHGRCSIDDLPDEVMTIIFGYGDCADIYASAPAVSTRWRALAVDTWTRTRPACAQRPRSDVDHVGPYIASITGDGAVLWRSYAHAEGCPMRARASIRAAREGRITVLYVLCRMLGHPWVPGICVEAAARGQLDVLNYASTHGHSYDEVACEAAAAAAGQYAVLDWLWKSKPPTRVDVDRAAENGNVHLLRLLQARRCPRGKSTMAAAARGGHVDAVTWLLRHRCPWGASAIAAAAGATRLDVLKLLLARWEEPLPLHAMEAAVSLSGSVACVDILWARIVADRRRAGGRRHGRDRRDSFDNATGNGDGDPPLVPPEASRWLALAARRGDLTLIEHLVHLGCRPTPAAFAAAAGGGHIDVLVALERIECAWDVSATAAAASHGRLEALCHLHERGCPWDETTCASAAGAGHIDCLKYARAHRCPWDVRVYTEAVRYGHVHVLVYARKSRCPRDDTVCHVAAVCSARSPQAAQYVRHELCRHRAKGCYLWMTDDTARAGALASSYGSSTKRKILGRMGPVCVLS
ncbi:F-box domain containing protein [Pandoravirus macleodensis]|uniref:F-box domain containing protein n=1 Tax=Pandoravirus macleodensis TaxID=2107707 RepID=A0A2U7UG78_9VIRU|nr:F-box domain containing protein [Pandoravirus macleodensis]AVK77519.1 F-box domain containing protein [Pandoravirus macleodensis]